MVENIGYFIGKTLKSGPEEVSLKHPQASFSSSPAHLHVQFCLAILLGLYFGSDLEEDQASSVLLPTMSLENKCRIQEEMRSWRQDIDFFFH